MHSAHTETRNDTGFFPQDRIYVRTPLPLAYFISQNLMYTHAQEYYFRAILVRDETYSAHTHVRTHVRTHTHTHTHTTIPDCRSGAITCPSTSTHLCSCAPDKGIMPCWSIVGEEKERWKEREKRGGGREEEGREEEGKKEGGGREKEGGGREEEEKRKGEGREEEEGRRRKGGGGREEEEEGREERRKKLREEQSKKREGRKKRGKGRKEKRRKERKGGGRKGEGKCTNKELFDTVVKGKSIMKLKVTFKFQELSSHLYTQYTDVLNPSD